MWQSLLKAEPPILPSRWGGTLEQWAKGKADIPTDLKLDEVREHWAKNDMRDYTASSASNLRGIIDRTKEELKEAPDTVGDLANNLTEKLIKFGKSKREISQALSKLEKLYSQLKPSNRYYDISVGGNTLESLGLVSPKGKTIDSWVVATLNRLYNNFVKNNSFENLQWLVKLVQEMQKESQYKPTGAIKELIKKPKEGFGRAFSKYQSDANVPTTIVESIKTAFDLTAASAEKTSPVPTRAGTTVEEIEDEKGRTRLVSTRGGEIYDKTKRRSGKSPQLDPQFLIDKQELKKKLQELKKELEANPNNKTIQRAVSIAQKEYDEFISQERKLSSLEERDKEVYSVAPDFTQDIINTSRKAFRDLFNNLVKTDVHNKLPLHGRTPLTWFRKRSIITLHNLAFGDAATQDVVAHFTPIDKISKDLDTSLRETRNVKQKQFIVGYINQQKEEAGEAAIEIAGVPLNIVGDTDPTTEIYIGPEESRMEEATTKLSSVLSDGSDEDLNAAWGRHLHSKEGEEVGEYSAQRKHGKLSSDEVSKIFGLGGAGTFKRNMFLSLLFSYYDSNEGVHQEGSPDHLPLYKLLMAPMAKMGIIHEDIQFTEPDADSFISTTQALITFIKVWLGNEALESYNEILSSMVQDFATNINKFVVDNADEFDEDADDKREILLTAFRKPESFNEVKGDWFGINNYISTLEKELNAHFKTIASEVVPNYFEELVRKIGNNTIVSPKKQRVKSKGKKVSIKDKLLDLGYLTRE